MRAAIVIAVILFVGLAWVIGNQQAAAPNGPTYEMTTVNTAAGPQRLIHIPDPPPPPDDSMEVARGRFTLSHLRWWKDAFDTVMMADFTFDNKNHFDVKDVEVKCTGFAPSGTAIDSNSRTIYDRFRADSKRTIAHFNMGFLHSQVASTSCSIVDFTIIPGSKRPAATASKGAAK
jgi:hypothetical protein